MRKSLIQGLGGSACGWMNVTGFESIPWRRVAVDVGLLVLFVVTSSWFVRG